MSARETVTLQRPSELEVAEFGITNKKWKNGKMEKQKQEFNSFRNIPDSFKKIVVVNGTKKPWRNEEGFVIMGMKYFLLNADSLEF